MIPYTWNMVCLSMHEFTNVIQPTLITTSSFYLGTEKILFNPRDVQQLFTISKNGIELLPFCFTHNPGSTASVRPENQDDESSLAIWFNFILPKESQVLMSSFEKRGTVQAYISEPVGEWNNDRQLQAGLFSLSEGGTLIIDYAVNTSVPVRPWFSLSAIREGSLLVPELKVL